MPLIIAATGHRPHKLSPLQRGNLVTVALQLFLEQRPFAVISGMALGWDTAFAEAAIALKIPLIAAVPFPQQPAKWAIYNIENWRNILKQCAHVEVIAKEYSLDALQRRNEWMVDHATLLAALWNGAPGGGTWNCLQYAKRQKINIVNLWSEL